MRKRGLNFTQNGHFLSYPIPSHFRLAFPRLLLCLPGLNARGRFGIRDRGDGTLLHMDEVAKDICHGHSTERDKV